MEGGFKVLQLARTAVTIQSEWLQNNRKWFIVLEARNPNSKCRQGGAPSTCSEREVSLLHHLLVALGVPRLVAAELQSLPSVHLYMSLSLCVYVCSFSVLIRLLIIGFRVISSWDPYLIKPSKILIPNTVRFWVSRKTYIWAVHYFNLLQLIWMFITIFLCWV